MGALYNKECEASDAAATKRVVHNGGDPVNVANERSERRLGVESKRSLLALLCMYVLNRTRYENKIAKTIPFVR